MARDPDQGGAFVFDLVDDGADDPQVSFAGSGAGGGPGAEPEPDGCPAGDAPLRDRERYLRVLGPVAAVLAVVLGTGLAVEGVRDGARMERMRDVPGGVADVSRPLDEAWTWDGPVGWAGATGDDVWGTEAVVLGDRLVVPSGNDLVALDPASGDVAWTARLGADPECGPLGSAGWGAAVARRLVCLTGDAADRVAVVVGPDGTVSAERVLDPADTERYGRPRPGPDGTVLRAQRVGPAPGPLPDGAGCDDMGECTGTVEEGRDVVLRAEDAVTGDERWNVTIPFRATRADQCANWGGDSWDGTVSTGQLNVEDFGAQVQDQLVQVYGCGVQSAVTPDGLVLGTRMDPGSGGVERLRSGGYAEYTFEGDLRTVLLDADGERVGEVEGYVLEPLTVTGPEAPTLMSAGGLGTRLASYALDGTPRWDVPAREGVQQFLAQVEGTAVMLAVPGSVLGVDLATGAERWTWDGGDPEGSSTGTLFVSRAFTDGRSVLLVVEDGSGAAGLTALDAETGEVVWERPPAAEDLTGDVWSGPVSGLLAVDGSLVEVVSSGARGLG
ncbi:PQQ-binding-like beta-propeller repeat protein [Promicromonospora sp. NPDC050880]|uniref:outer membrane protein assembly factor BamB family protein n=1 Tax=Promicromonospora sp. NPDC050880 TaxID=3364406 RepID=UPI00379E94C0